MKKNISVIKKNVLVFFGGKSVEHDISIITGVQTINALNKNKYNVYPIYISKDGNWYFSNEFYNIKIFQDNFLRSSKKVFMNFSNKTLYCLKRKKIKEIVKIDFAFICMHGAKGEDGCLQGLLEMAEIDYSSCSVLSSSVGINKLMTKTMLEYLNIKTPKYIYLFENEIKDINNVIMTYFNDKNNMTSKQDVINKNNNQNILSNTNVKKFKILEDNKKESYVLKNKKNNNKISDNKQVNEKEDDKKLNITIDKLNFPVIVKPCCLGSSIGINLCKNKEQLKNAISFAFLFDNAILIEEAITDLKEVNIAIMGNSEEMEVSDIEEVFYEKDFLTFEDKYLSEGGAKGIEKTKRIIPASIDEKYKIEIENISKKVFKFLNCKGIIRFDFLIDKGSRKVYLNEFNTIPGSMANYLWKTKKYEFSDLLDKIYEFSLSEKKYRKKITNFSSSVLTNIGNCKLMK